MEEESEKVIRYWIKESIKNKAFEDVYEIDKELGR